MTSKVTDIHIHLLPGLDDGAQSKEETLAVLKEAAAQQIRRIIVTPHFYPGRYEVTAEEALLAFDEVRELCQKESIPIELYAGQECFYYSELADQLDRGNVLTMADSRYVLVEFETQAPFSKISGGLRDLLNRGYVPILAHFERYVCLQNEDRLLKLKTLGVRLQMSFDAVRIPDRLFKKNAWRKAAMDGMVDYFGSDCHGMQFRPLRVREACEWLEQNLDHALLTRIFQKNIEDVLKNR